MPGHGPCVARRMTARRLNTAGASCEGPFGAVAGIIGLRREATFEGQAATGLETAAHPDETRRSEFAVARGRCRGGRFPAGDRADRKSRAGGRERGSIAARFHNTVSKAAREGRRLQREETRTARACWSGERGGTRGLGSRLRRRGGRMGLRCTGGRGRRGTTAGSPWDRRQSRGLGFEEATPPAARTRVFLRR